MLLELAFWLAAGTIVYAYIGYPILLVGLQVLFERPVRKAPIEPTVSLLIPAYNEAHVIAARIENALGLDYPKEALEIVVASDGSTDGTGEAALRSIAQQGATGRVRLVTYPTNRGKTAVINDTLPTLRGEIVVFTDASAMFAPDAIRQLVTNYADPSVGAVGGVYRVSGVDTAAIGSQEDFYWRYETFLKQLEASIGSVLGAHGQIYSIRKALHPFPPVDTINEDYVIPVMVLQRGYRVAYEPSAVVFEDAHEMSGFGRRVRIAAGNLQQLREVRHFVRPFRPGILFAFVSHKVLRIVVPFAMLAALALNLLMLDDRRYRAILGVQLAFYGLAGLGALIPLRPKVLRLPYYFCMINAATLAATYHAGWSRRDVTWN